MERAVQDSYSGHKRPRSVANEKYYSDTKRAKFSATASKVIDFSDPNATRNLVRSLDCGKFGSVTNDIKALLEQRMLVLYPYFKAYPELISQFLDVSKTKEKPDSQQLVNVSCNDVINLDDDDDDGDSPTDKKPKTSIITIDSDEEEDQGGDGPSYSFQSVFSNQIVATNLEVITFEKTDVGAKKERQIETRIVVAKTENDYGVYEGVSEESENSNVGDEYEDIWNEMSMGIELSKDVDISSVPSQDDDEEEEDAENICDHSFVLRDDTGYVCRVCGEIGKRIDKIFEFQYIKVKRSTRTYMPDSRNDKDKESVKIGGLDYSDNDTGAKVYAHPRHTKRMKSHQVQGFQFLVDNLVGEKPGGCILAHAPGSGKTFMIISFMQSFLAKYPNARPLVVLPKGILSTWKKEFQIWQIEDIPLLDFYSVKADNRTQQLEVLKKWVKTKSVLFLGYKQFSVIVCDQQSDEVSNSCKEILLKAPSILILDEGHTPRNDETDVFGALAKVQTPRKVVLSGTLYQNHVKEVFNILNLVRPKFLRMENTRPIVKRIMSKVDISGARIKASGNAAFYDSVEATLQKDKDFRRKVSVIHDLREMTGKVLHYYKGDFLDELPGLIDLTLVLNLSPKQKREVGKINSLTRKFKASSVGSAVYLHPKLDMFSDTSATDEKMDQLLENINIEDGVKAKFFLNMLRLCESKKEKLLVFSQYLTPLKFLERLAAKEKGWRVGMEMFVITGDSSSEQREFSMEQLNNSPSARVLFGSIKACGEGISLVGASRIIILDIHLNPSVTRQAIGRAFRPGQKNKVFSYRLVAGESLEEEDQNTCLKKELISRMWFEWNEYCGNRDFEVKTVTIKECEDDFLINCPKLTEDIRALYKR